MASCVPSIQCEQDFASVHLSSCNIIDGADGENRRPPRISFYTKDNGYWMTDVTELLPYEKASIRRNSFMLSSCDSAAVEKSRNGRIINLEELIGTKDTRDNGEILQNAAQPSFKRNSITTSFISLSEYCIELNDENDSLNNCYDSKCGKFSSNELMMNNSTKGDYVYDVECENYDNSDVSDDDDMDNGHRHQKTALHQLCQILIFVLRNCLKLKINYLNYA